MSREDEELRKEDQLSIFKSFCTWEELPAEAYNEMRLSAALMWSSHDIYRNAFIFGKFGMTESKKLMVNTVQKTLQKNLRLFHNLSVDIQLMFAYQFTVEHIFGGSFICKEKQSFEGLYIIKKGCVDVISPHFDGGMVTLGPGSFFGELNLIIEGPCSVVVR